MFIAAQSVGVPSSRPKSVGTSARVNSTEVIEIEAVGLDNDKVNKKSWVPFAPVKQSATTKSTGVLPQGEKSMLPEVSP